MEHLKNKTYRDFVRDHVLRPYQSGMISESDKPVQFTRRLYNDIPVFVKENPEWAEKVFDRISRIFKTIDTDVFPGDLPAMVILTECAKRGVTIEYT